MTRKNNEPPKVWYFLSHSNPSRNFLPEPPPGSRNSSPPGIYSGKNCGQAVSVQVTVGRKREHKWGIPKPRERFCALFCPSNTFFQNTFFPTSSSRKELLPLGPGSLLRGAFHQVSPLSLINFRNKSKCVANLTLPCACACGRSPIWVS